MKSLIKIKISCERILSIMQNSRKFCQPLLVAGLIFNYNILSLIYFW
ncbi:MAG: hypothetical protein ACI9XR_001650, partial [Flavobacterium sp.]